MRHKKIIQNNNFSEDWRLARFSVWIREHLRVSEV